MNTKILELLEPAAVVLHTCAPDAGEIITRLGNLLLETGYVRTSFVQAAIAREKELPTGLPLGGSYNAAIPHTDAEHVLKPGLAMATLSHPITFQNMVIPEEAVPVQLVILMALDQPKTQVEMLQEIAGVLQDAAVINRLMEAEDYQDIQKVFT
jgi:PTS system galactitol-specific IIA component